MGGISLFHSRIHIYANILARKLYKYECLFELFHSGRISGEAEIPMNPKDKSEFKFLHGSVTRNTRLRRMRRNDYKLYKVRTFFLSVYSYHCEVAHPSPAPRKEFYADISATVLLNR